MGTGPHSASMKSFVIAASIQRQIDAQKDGPPKRIPVIICLKESVEHPDLGVQPSKDKIKAFLSGKATQITESDFYLFASLSRKTSKILPISGIGFTKSGWTKRPMLTCCIPPTL